MSQHPRQIEADMIRTLYKLGLVGDFLELDRIINELQLRLFAEDGYSTRRSPQPTGLTLLRQNNSTI